MFVAPSAGWFDMIPSYRPDEPEGSVMWDVLTDPIGQTVIVVAIGFALFTVGIYILAKIRPKSIQSEPKTEDLLRKFSESHREGELDDQEYRNIKTSLNDRLQEELEAEAAKARAKNAG